MSHEIDIFYEDYYTFSKSYFKIRLIQPINTYHLAHHLGCDLDNSYPCRFGNYREDDRLHGDRALFYARYDQAGIDFYGAPSPGKPE